MKKVLAIFLIVLLASTVFGCTKTTTERYSKLALQQIIRLLSM